METVRGSISSRYANNPDILHTGMTGTNFLNLPDGRVGWADYFLCKGYEVGEKLSFDFPASNALSSTSWTNHLEDALLGRMALTAVKARSTPLLLNHDLQQQNVTTCGLKHRCIHNGLVTEVWETTSTTGSIPQLCPACPLLSKHQKRSKRQGLNYWT